MFAIPRYLSPVCINPIYIFNYIIDLKFLTPSAGSSLYERVCKAQGPYVLLHPGIVLRPSIIPTDWSRVIIKQKTTHSTS